MQVSEQKSNTVAVPDVAAYLSELLSKVGNGSEITITEEGRPVARLVPFAPTSKRKSGFGCMAGTFEITGDIMSPEPDSWDAMR